MTTFRPTFPNLRFFALFKQNVSVFQESLALIPGHQVALKRGYEIRAVTLASSEGLFFTYRGSHRTGFPALTVNVAMVSSETGGGGGGEVFLNLAEP